MNMRAWHAIALAAVLVTSALVASPFQITLLTKSVVWAILAMSVWFLLRVCDRPSLGHAAFFGVSAYVTAIAITRWDYSNVWTVLGVSLVMSTLAGVFVAIVAGRLNDVHFLLVTLAFAEMLRSLTTRWRELGGDDGVTGVTRPSAWPLPVDLDAENLLWVALAALALVLAIIVTVVRSPFGAVLLGLKDSESRMAALGYSPFAYRTAGFTLSATIAGLAGWLNAILTRFVSPSELSPIVSARALLIVVVGGTFALVGSVIVAFGLTFVEDILSSHTQHWPGLIGGIYVLIAIGRSLAWREWAQRIVPRRTARPVRPRATLGVEEP